MTNSLIPVFNGSISNASIQLCNARELHSFLEIGKQYGTWITDRITDYGFVQDEDYIIVTERTNGRPRKEYHITLDMGKELAMVERNEKGRQVRKYFIECEREMKRLQKEAENQPLAPPKPVEKIFTRNIINHEAVDLAWLWFEANQMAGFIKEMTPALEALGSSYAPRAHSIAYEYGRHLHDIGKLVYRLTAEADFGHNPRPMRELENHFAKPTKSVRIAKF